MEEPCRRSRPSACNRTTGSCIAGVSRCGAAEERVGKAQEEGAVEAQEEPEVVDGDNKDKTPSNALDGLCGQARLRVHDRTTGGPCTGASCCRTTKECVNKAQEERAVEAQEKPEAVNEVDEDKAPSNALEGSGRQAKLSALGRTIGGWGVAEQQRSASTRRRAGLRLWAV